MRTMTATALHRRVAHALVLLGIIGLSGYYQARLIGKMSRVQLDEPYGLFYTEAAFHYRYFERVSRGQGIPDVDTAIQHPEGFRPFTYETPVMEQVLGRFHRTFFSSVAPHRFVAGFAILCSAPLVLLAFAGGRVLWGSSAAGYLAALFAAFSQATFSRSVTGLFLREMFALPFVFASFVCWLYCLRKDDARVGALGAVAMTVALASWHVTHIYLSVFMAGVAVLYLLSRGRGLPVRAFAVLTVFLVAASGLLPVLRAKYYLVSPPLMLACGLWLCRRFLPLDGRGGLRLLSAAVLAACVAAGVAVQRGLGVDTHVLDLMWGKLRFWGELPDDSRLLSFEAKSMWTGPFLSPSGRDVLYYFWGLNVLAPLAVGIVAWRAWRRQAAAAELVAAAFALVFYSLFLLTVRLNVFAVFFMVLPLGALTLLPRRGLRTAAYAFGAASLLFHNYFLYHHKIEPARPPLDATNEVLDYLRTATPTDAVVLAGYEMGPSIALYAERPVILHSKFESKLLRDKVEAFYRALYGSEDDLYAFARRHGARYFVYQVYMALLLEKGGAAYTADALPLATANAPFRLHFQPETLRRFSLCYQNAMFRVFRIDDAPCPVTIDYQPIYDSYTFLGDDAAGPTFERAHAARGLARLSDPRLLTELGARFHARGDDGAAARQYEKAVEAGHDPFDILPGYSEVLDGLGRTESMAAYLRLLRRIRPDFAFDSIDVRNGTYWLALADVVFKDGQPARAIEHATLGLVHRPESEYGHLLRGAAYATTGQYAKALADFEAARRINPRSVDAHNNIGGVYRMEAPGWRRNAPAAMAAYRASLAIRPDQPAIRTALESLERR
jgi:tetratricopeptide (TPR) repeat protein